jgi:hypothetical protein
MKRLMRVCLWFYPPRWRARYGEEFLALIEDARPRGGDVWDVMQGAMAMQLKTGGFVKLVLGFALAGALVAGVWSAMLPKLYVSMAALRMRESTPYELQQRLQQAQQVALSRKSLSEIIQRENLYAEERKSQSLEDLVQRMRNRDIRITAWPGGDRNRVMVSVSNPDPHAAQRTTRDIVNALIAEAPVIEVTDPATEPKSPNQPNPRKAAANGLLTGLAAGLLCAAVWAIVQRRERWSWKRVAAFAAAGMVLGGTIGFLLPDQYISTAVLRAEDGAKLQAAIEQALSTSSLARIIRKDGLYPRDVARGSVEEAAVRMRNQSIRVQKIPVVGPFTAGTPFIVSFQYPDHAHAQQVTRELIAAIIEANVTTHAGIMEVLDPASDPLRPSSPNRPQIIVLGVLGGLLLGLASTRFTRLTPAAV